MKNFLSQHFLFIALTFMAEIMFEWEPKCHDSHQTSTHKSQVKLIRFVSASWQRVTYLIYELFFIDAHLYVKKWTNW